MNRVAILSLAFLLAASMLAMPSQAVSYGAMGSKVIATSTDRNPVYTGTAVAGATLCARDIGTTGSALDDLFYINVDGAGTVVAAFDIRLTAGESKAAGSMVGTGDADVGQTFNSAFACTAMAAGLQFLEADGLPGWSAGDFLVWSADTTLGQGDLRLSVSTSNTGQDTNSVSAGTIVQAGAVDLTSISNNNGQYPDCTGSPPTGAACGSLAILQGAGGFALRHVDNNLNAAVDSGDQILATPEGATATPDPLSPNINDVYLHIPSGTFGGKLLRSSTDYLVEPEVLCGGGVTAGCYSTAPTLGYIRAIGASDTSCDRLFIHFRDFDQVADVVQPGDIVLYSPSSTASCPSPVPSSGVTPGTAVSSATTHFQGSAFQTASTALAPLLFYVDANGNGRYGATDPVYINKPAAFGGAAPLAVSAGDVRVTAVTAGASTFTAGSIVGSSDADIGAFSTLNANPDSATMSWFVRKLNNDGADEIALTAMTSVIYHDVNADSIWNPATESVYRDVGATANGCGATGTTMCVNTGDFLLHAGSDTALTPSTTSAITCPGPADCAFLTGTFKSGSNDFKVTGSDATVEAARGETMYWSKDAIVNDEDFRLSAAVGGPADAQVSCAANACDNEGMHASDVLYFSHCPTAACPGRLQNADIQVSPTVGTRITSASADFVPSLLPLPTAGGTLLRYNRNDATSVADDTFYASTDGATPTVQDARLTPFASMAAGTVLSSTDSQELTATMVADAAALDTRIAARDVDGIAGYTLNDAVYVNNAGAGLGGAADAVLSAYDLRLTGATGGAQTFNAGTIVLAGNGDLNAGNAFIGLGSWLVGFHDDNLNGIFDNGDVMYALPPGSPALATMPSPSLGAVRLSGSGVASGSGGGGGGGGTTPVTTPTPTPTPTPSTSDSGSDSASDSSSQTQTGSSDLAAANQAIQASLTVTRSGEDNVLSWDSQPGVDGYQVFSSNSPFVLLTTLIGQATNSFTHADADEDTAYVVTAYVAGSQLTADDVNAGDVPGYTGVPSGETPAGEGGDGGDGKGGKGFIPAPSFALVAVALAGVVLALRRRL